MTFLVQINNAGYLNNDETPETAVTTLQTNYYGVKNVTKAVLPILRPSAAGARVIIVSSALGQLEVCSLSVSSPLLSPSVFFL